MGRFSRRKGVRGEIEARNAWRALFPNCERTAQRRGDAGHADLSNTGPLHIEVKHGYNRYMARTRREVEEARSDGPAAVILDGYVLVTMSDLLSGAELRPVSSTRSAVRAMREWVGQALGECDDGSIPMVHYQFVGGPSDFRDPVIITTEENYLALVHSVRSVASWEKSES